MRPQYWMTWIPHGLRYFLPYLHVECNSQMIPSRSGIYVLRCSVSVSKLSLPWYAFTNYTVCSSFQCLRASNFFNNTNMNQIQAMAFIGNCLRNNLDTNSAWILMGLYLTLLEKWDFMTDSGHRLNNTPCTEHRTARRNFFEHANIHCGTIPAKTSLVCFSFYESRYWSLT